MQQSVQSMPELWIASHACITLPLQCKLMMSHIFLLANTSKVSSTCVRNRATRNAFQFVLKVTLPATETIKIVKLLSGNKKKENDFAVSSLSIPYIRVCSSYTNCNGSNYVKVNHPTKKHIYSEQLRILQFIFKQEPPRLRSLRHACTSP